MLWLGLAIGGAAVVAVGLAAVIHVITTHAIWVVLHREHRLIEERPSREELRTFVASAAFEAWATFLFFALKPLAIFEPPLRKKACPPGRRPILLIHGYTQSWHNFLLLGPRLGRAGLGPRYTINLRPIFGDLDHLARAASDRIDRILALTGAGEIDLVAHSMGGLVARRLASWDQDAGRSRVRRIVTLGSPHRGTWVAHLAIGPSARAMRPGSAFLAALPPRAGLTSILSRHDNVVIPAGNAEVDPPGVNVWTAGTGHFGLLIRARVAQLVVEALRAEEPRSLVAEPPPSVQPEPQPDPDLVG